MKSVPVHKRKHWLDSEDGQDYLEDVRGAMQQDRGIDLVHDDREPTRVVTISPKRPKGLRAQIIEQVAAEETVRRGAPFSARMVRTCWDEYRRLERDSP